MTSHFPSLLMIGAGRMGQAMLAGWRSAGKLDGARVEVIERYGPTIETLREQFGITALTDAAEASHAPDLLLLAVKPQQLREVLSGLPAGLIGPDTLIVSIAAGTGLATIAAALPAGQPVLRIMPNTPVRVRQGIFGCIGNASFGQGHRMRAEALLSPLGEVVWLEDEDQMHGFTALAGSGPAYLFAVIESLAKAAVAEGLPPREAQRIAAATVAGAGRLALEDGRPARALRDEVVSPGGTTQAGLEPLDAANPDRIFADVLRAASKRSRELAGE